jgi:hypothetical protein
MIRENDQKITRENKNGHPNECIRIFGSGKPRGVGISGKRPHGVGEGNGSQFTSNPGTRWTDPVTARRVPSK